MSTQQSLLPYVVITPVRNEAEYIEKTLQSMVSQTHPPAEWVIVNDGSTDDTAAIVTRYASDYPWINLTERSDRGSRQRGKGVVEAFYDGVRALRTEDYQAIVKLDGDLSFEAGYFAFLMQKFAQQPKLGIIGGAVYERLDGVNWVRQAVKGHVRGPTKVYRRACFDQIGGLVPVLGWDGVDEWMARAYGWQAHTFTELKVMHYRVTGGATGTLKARKEKGYGAYYMCYHPAYMIARATRDMFRPPYVIGGLTMLGAFFLSPLLGREKLTDPVVVKYIRHTQWQQVKGLLQGNPVYDYGE